MGCYGVGQLCRGCLLFSPAVSHQGHLEQVLVCLHLTGMRMCARLQERERILEGASIKKYFMLGRV